MTAMMNRLVGGVGGVGAAMIAAMVVGCAAPAEESEPEQTESAAQPLMRNGAGGGVKTKGELEADGYTCTTWPGTTVTECTKWGSPTYTCDSAGRCSVLFTTTTQPIIVSPMPTVIGW